MFSFGQVEDYTIYGESLWRNQGYGVEHHFFQISNYHLLNSTEYYVAIDPETDDCPYEVYTTDFMELSDPTITLPYNTLKIRPYSDNDAADYRNGVSTLDLVAIQNHLLSSPDFESRTPTEDFPFRYISGDADYDHDVDEDDMDMIHDLILFNRDDLTRNSWEWVHKDEVEDAEERFEEEPYQFVIDYNWPGSEGIILAASSTNEIMADNDKYFTFRTTKIGDISASSMTAVSYNDWVCGTGAYFTDGGLSTRSASVVPIRKGSTLMVSVWLENREDLFGLEIPLYFDESELTLNKLTFTDDFYMRWHRNPSHNSLVFADFSRDKTLMDVPRGKLVVLELTANKDISDFNQSIRIYPGRNIEVIGENEEVYAPEVSIELDEVVPSEFYAEVRRDQSEQDVIYLESPISQWVDLNLFTLSGQLIDETQFWVERGQSLHKLPMEFLSGMYVCTLEGREFYSLKWIKH